MNQFEENLSEVLNKNLGKHTPSIEFKDVWRRESKSMRIFGLKKAFAIPVMALLIAIVLLTVGFAGGYQVNRITDKTDYPFVNDHQVIGAWKTVDFVQNIDNFVPGQKSWNANLYLTGYAFIKDGSMLVSLSEGNGNLAYSPSSWTKGLIINKQEETAEKYEIRNIDGSTYMFVQWKSGDYVFGGMIPYYYVLQKVDSKDYSNYKEQVIKDNINYPFVDDPRMVGKWETVDFVKKIDDYKPGVTSWLDGLYLKTFDISKKGEINGTTTDGSFPNGMLTWTKGMILNNGMQTASKCEIREMDGNTYMFFEWKSGDYTLRGMQPSYYVLKKVL